MESSEHAGIRNLMIVAGLLARRVRSFSPSLLVTKSMSSFTDSTSCKSLEAHPSGYIDAHAHLIHEKFVGEEDAIAVLCKEKGVDYVIVNGLEPISNRAVLELCQRHSNLLPACGIYPIDAACSVISPENWNHPFDPPAKFDVDAEVDWIDELARTKQICAIGECGLDKHYLTDSISMNEQERVLRLLMKVAKKHDIPLILHRWLSATHIFINTHPRIHLVNARSNTHILLTHPDNHKNTLKSRKQESRLLEMLLEEKVIKADIHCFCGPAKLGLKYAENGYYLSIPSAVEKQGSSFRKLVELLPMDKILTETDSPYMGPDKGQRNDPTTVVRGVAAIADIKNITPDDARTAIRDNFRQLFAF